MLKKIKLKNSTILLIGFILVFIGVCIGFIEFYMERKNKVFSDMNILLYETENPDNITSNDIIEENQSNEENSNESTEEPLNESAEENKQQTQFDYVGILEIPKIKLKRGFLDLNSKYNSVNYNITLIKGSTFPDEENNNLILAAHSGVCSICFFDKLFDLSTGDEANLYYKNIKYTYKLVKTYEVTKDGTVPIYRDYNKSVLTLITCTKNSKTKQTVFIFELA